MRVRFVSVLAALALLAGAPVAAAERAVAPTVAPSIAPSVTPSVATIDEATARLLPAACRDALPLVVQSNELLLDDHDTSFCRGMPEAKAREDCRRRVATETHARPAGPIEVYGVREASEAGRDWPGRERVASFRKIEARLPIEKAGRRSQRDLTFLCFDSKRADGVESCTFPASHWFWSDLTLPDRFAAPPRGICGGKRVLTFTEYLREAPPPPESLWAIRFLSRAEADAWTSGDPERIKHRGTWNADHEYAKFFLVNSLSWWRGKRPETPRADYAFAVRLPPLSLDWVLDLERRGEGYLNVFEEGEAIELTLIGRGALVDAVSRRPEILEDVSRTGANGPELRPLPSAGP
jgi:hypothetical protein